VLYRFINDLDVNMATKIKV